MTTKTPPRVFQRTQAAGLPLMALLLGGLCLTFWAPTALAGPAQPLAQQGLQDQDTAQETPEQRRERMRKIAEERRKAREAIAAQETADAEKIYAQYAKAYLNNDMATVEELYREVRLKQRHLTRDQQMAIRHMNDMAPKYRPRWWDGTKKQEKNSFKAEIWGREFWANYVPSRELGVQAVFPKEEFNRKTGRYEVVDLIILVTWKPLMVDSPEAAEGALAKKHGYKLGDIAEVIVWHELGHNYITEQVSTRANVELYTRYGELYSTMHEYFADMAALYHSTPRARKIVLQFRLDELDYYTKDSSHCRGAHGIGAIVTSDMLKNPEAWPSVHFPPKVPKDQVELNTIIYIYENLPAQWTPEEDIRLQGLAEEYIMKHGERTFKSKGEFTLPSNLNYNLMISEDRENQAKRDEWVRHRLEELISDGRADQLKEGETYDPPERDKSRRSHFRTFTLDEDGKPVPDKDGPPRIEVPWEF